MTPDLFLYARIVERLIAEKRWKYAFHQITGAKR